MAKNYSPFSLLFVVSKVFEKFVKIGLLITSRDVAFFYLLVLDLGLLNQMQIL